MAKHVDATSRAKRTVLQGAILAALTAIVNTLIFALGGATPEQFFTVAFWRPTIMATVFAACMALLSYVQRVLEERREPEIGSRYDAGVGYTRFPEPGAFDDPTLTDTLDADCHRG